MNAVILATTGMLRSWYRDVIVSEHELFCGAAIQENTASTRYRPPGECDVAAYLKSLPPPWNEPSLVLNYYDMLMETVVRNLRNVRCPRILSVCDMHHFVPPITGPIWQPIVQAVVEPYDLVIVEYTRQHLHFFVEAGVKNCAWLPAFSVHPHEIPARCPRQHGITFIGGQQYHPYRKHVVQTLVDAGLPMTVGQTPSEVASQTYADSVVSLNISLNGDLNLRVLEVLAAGGCLLTDRLSPEAGLALLFEQHRHLEIFDNADQARDLARYFVDHEAEARTIAVAGQAEYFRRHRPALKIQQLLAMLEGDVPEDYRPERDPRTTLPRESLPRLRRRVAVYEFLQELHRVNLRLRVLFWSGTARQASDALDLVRLDASILRGPADEQLLESCGMTQRLTWLDPQSLDNLSTRWDVVLCNAADFEQVTTRCLLTERSTIVAVVDNEELTAPAINAVIRRYELTMICEDPPSFGTRSPENRPWKL